MATAQELIAQAEAATTEAELDDIEAQAEGRSTVLSAVDLARGRIAQTTSGGSSMTQPSETEPATEEPTASKTDPDEAQVDAASGLLLPNAKIAGGAIREVLEPEPDPKTPRRDLAALYSRAAASAVAQKAGAAIGRPVSDWGLLTKGDEIPATMTLVDLDSGQKVETMGGNKTILKDDRLFANARNFPQHLVEGDTLEQLVGGGGASGPTTPEEPDDTEPSTGSEAA
jgi:hypothetical protein